MICDLITFSHQSRLEPPTLSHEDQALYSDGGYSPSVGATFCCQTRSFGAAGEYWNTSFWVSRKLSGRLPARYGWNPIHTAELQALVSHSVFGPWTGGISLFLTAVPSPMSCIDGFLHQLLALNSRKRSTGRHLPHRLPTPRRVGLDIKSHQSGPLAPFPILVQGNEVQD